jgi:hypothetical protein
MGFGEFVFRFIFLNTTSTDFFQFMCSLFLPAVTATQHSTTTGAQPPTRPSSAIAAKAIPAQTKPWR